MSWRPEGPAEVSGDFRPSAARPAASAVVFFPALFSICPGGAGGGVVHDLADCFGAPPGHDVADVAFRVGQPLVRCRCRCGGWWCRSRPKKPAKPRGPRSTRRRPAGGPPPNSTAPDSNPRPPRGHAPRPAHRRHRPPPPPTRVPQHRQRPPNLRPDPVGTDSMAACRQRADPHGRTIATLPGCSGAPAAAAAVTRGAAPEDERVAHQRP